MIDVTDIEIYRDGGTIEFRISGSSSDGFYRLQTPFLGTPEPLFKDGHQLEFGSSEEAAVLAVLQEWINEFSTAVVVEALGELDKMKLWLNLPQNLSDVVPIHYIRAVIERLRTRCI